MKEQAERWEVEVEVEVGEEYGSVEEIEGPGGRPKGWQGEDGWRGVKEEGGN